MQEVISLGEGGNTCVPLLNLLSMRHDKVFVIFKHIIFIEIVKKYVYKM